MLTMFVPVRYGEEAIEKNMFLSASGSIRSLSYTINHYDEIQSTCATFTYPLLGTASWCTLWMSLRRDALDTLN